MLEPVKDCFWKPNTKEIAERPQLCMLDFVKPIGPVVDAVTRDFKIQTEIQKLGKNGDQALLDAVKTNRVVGVADIHTSRPYPNSVLSLLSTMMPEFKKAGITHLALEVNKRDHQSILDNVMKTGRFDKKTGRAIDFNDEWVKMLESAAACGIKLVAVDDNPDRDPIGDLTRKENQHRETFMANEIAKIVDSNSKSRVLWPVGDLHLTRRPGADGYKWAGQQLTEHSQKGGWSLKTFASDIGTARGPFEFIDVEKPTAVNLKDAKTMSSAKLRTSIDDPRMPDSRVGDFDAILFMPWSQELKQAEKAEGAKSPKLLPILDKYISDYQRGLPLRTLNLCEKALPIEEQVYGAKSPHVAMRVLLMSKLCEQLNRDQDSSRYRQRGEKLLKELDR